MAEASTPDASFFKIHPFGAFLDKCSRVLATNVDAQIDEYNRMLAGDPAHSICQ